MTTDQFARLSANGEPVVPVLRRRSRDISGGILLIVAGAVGLLAWFGPWSDTVSSVTGKSVAAAFEGLPQRASWAFCIKAIAIIGAANVLLGLALLIKSYLRRYIGTLAMLGAMGAIGIEVYYLIQSSFDFAGTYYGFWAFIGFGLVSLIAALKALGTP